MRSIPFLLLAHIAASSFVSPPDPEAPIEAVRVALDPSDPARTSVGPLRFLGGWELRSARADFGGISGLHVSNGHLLAISDAGSVFRFNMRGDGRMVGARFGTLPAGPGTGATKADRDAEALAVDPATGKLWVAFERHNAIWRYGRDLARAEAHAEPAAMASWPSNNGPEAMARLADGRFVVISEGTGKPAKIHKALLYGSDPTRPGARPARFRYHAPIGFSVTDTAQLPDGRLLVLHRHYSLMNGVAAALVVVDPEEIKEGATVLGRRFAHFKAPLTLDNFEALSIERIGRRTILWLASDDNFSPLQRTLLMKFELVE